MVGLGVTRFWKSCAKLFCWVLAGRDMDSGWGEDDGGWGWEHVRISHWVRPYGDTTLRAMGAVRWRKSVIW